jgi:phytoene dehydrogenase-like protein
MSEKIFDTLVLGSGAGGMTAALATARRGHSVLLLEAGKAYGGMLNPFSRKHYHFDIGIHYIGECGPRQALRRTLDHLGLESLQFNEINPDGFDRYVFPGYEGLLCKGIDRWGDWLCEHFPGEAGAIRKFMELMKAAESLMRTVWRGPSLADTARLARFSFDVVRALHQPLSSLLDAYFRDPRLKNIIAGPGGDLGLPPSRVSAYGSILLLTHYLGGAYYPVGGTKAYRDAYVEGLVRAGVELHRNQVVTEIHVEPDLFTVRTAAGGVFRGRTVISNIDASDTVPLITGARPGWLLQKRAARSRPSLGSVCVFLGTDLDLTKTKVTDANIWHYDSEEIDRWYARVAEGAFPDEMFYFLTAPTLKDPHGHKAPSGHHTLEIITMASMEPFRRWAEQKTMKRGEEYERFKDDLGERLIAAVERDYLPGLRQHITIQEVSTPATNVSFVRARHGGIYGPELTPDQATYRRFFPTTGISGLYLAGSSVLGAGVMPCTMSGMMAAKLACKELAARKPRSVSTPRRAPAVHSDRCSPSS